jgi:hypothetical protein
MAAADGTLTRRGCPPAPSWRQYFCVLSCLAPLVPRYLT